MCFYLFVYSLQPCPTIESEGSIIPANSFATFSGDGTIRIWNLDHPVHPSSSSPLTPPQLSPPLMTPSSSTMVSAQRRNIYSRELVKMLYVDPDAAEFMKQSKHPGKSSYKKKKEKEKHNSVNRRLCRRSIS